MQPYIIAKFMVNEKIIQDQNGSYIKGYAFNNLKVDILPKLKHRGFLPSTAQHRLFGD